MGRRDPDQKERASEIRHDRDRQRAEDEHATLRHRQPLQFAEEQTDHQRRLERPHSAARFVHAHHAATYPDQIPFQLRWHAEERHHFRRHRRHRPHQALHDRVLDRRNPRHRHEEETDRKRKMPQPRLASRGPDEEQRQGRDRRRVHPIHRPPIRIRHFKQPDRKQNDQRSNRDPNRDSIPHSTFRVPRFSRRPIFPPQQKKERCEERHEPSVTVLLVDRPFAAEMPAEHEPKREERERDEGQLRFRDGRIQDGNKK